MGPIRKAGVTGFTFVFTGTLPNFKREDAKYFVELYDGKVSNTINRITDYLVIGDKPGRTKLQAASRFGTRTINEEQFIALLNLVRVGE